jgi:transcriptional regulator with XRE-family HTH domain
VFYRFSSDAFNECLARSGKSRKRVAKEARCTKQAIGHYTTGARTPTTAMLGRLAVVLQCEPSDFFELKRGAA